MHDDGDSHDDNDSLGLQVGRPRSRATGGSVSEVSDRRSDVWYLDKMVNGSISSRVVELYKLDIWRVMETPHSLLSTS